MDKKFIFGGLAGGVAYFLLGWVIYGMLLKDAMAGWAGSDPISMKETPDFLHLIIGNMFIGFFLSYVFTKWAGVKSLMGGLMAGATIGLFVTAGFDFTFFATSNAFNFTGVIMDTITGTVMFGLTGAVVGGLLGALDK